MNSTHRVLTLFLTAGLSAASTFAEGPYEELLEPYHQLRSALVEDDLATAGELAGRIEERALAALDRTQTGAEAPEWSELVEEIAGAAAVLGSADDLTVAREAFFSLSKPLSRYRKLVGDEGTVVAYCSMSKKAWLQDDGEIENPYQGQAMPTCGEKIPD